MMTLFPLRILKKEIQEKKTKSKHVSLCNPSCVRICFMSLPAQEEK